MSALLDLTEQPEDEAGDVVDRKYWESRASKDSLALMDTIIKLVEKTVGEVRVKYNRGHVALGTSGTNFMWFHPRKGKQIFLNAEPGEDARKILLPKFEERGMEFELRRTHEIKANISARDIEESNDLIKELILACDQYSRT